MKKFAVIAALVAAPAFAHPNGTYKIDNDAAVTVTFLATGRCPVVDGALPGTLRTLTFSEAAVAEPYEFVSGNYVEIHEGEQEIYVQTDDQCVPAEEGQRIPAGRSDFGGYDLRRI